MSKCFPYNQYGTYELREIKTGKVVESFRTYKVAQNIKSKLEKYRYYGEDLEIIKVKEIKK